MTSTITQAKESLNRNVSAPMVVSTVVGMAVFGGIMYFAVKSGIKPLKDVANVAKGGA